MSNYNFGEKTKEWSNKQGQDIPVWQSPKYIESKAKAVEILDSGKFVVCFEFAAYQNSHHCKLVSIALFHVS